VKRKRDDETRAKGREGWRESTSANVKYVTIGKVESKGAQAADEARRRSATARGFRRRGGGKEEQGGDVGAEGERGTERIPRGIPKRTHLIDTNVKGQGSWRQRQQRARPRGA
jgi:hypothetical protein